MPAAPERAAGEAPPVLVAAIGHAWLRDQAFGLKVVEALRGRGLPPSVVLADWSFGTITAFQRLCERRYARAIFVSGTPRDRIPGTLHRFVPSDELPPPDEIQARVADCVMGMVSVDNLLVIGRYYGALPDDVVLVEAEPADETWGAELSPEVARVFDDAVAAVLAEVGRPVPAVGPGAEGGEGTTFTFELPP